MVFEIIAFSPILSSLCLSFFVLGKAMISLSGI